MTDSEMFTFMDVFRGLLQVFPKRGDEHDKTETGRAYFKAMKRYNLAQVTAGSEIWMQRGKYFPKPAEWMDAIPRISAKPESVTMSAVEAAEWLDAERRVWEGEPCGCPPCREAGVDHRFTRFVPEFTDDDREKRATLGERSVVRGHWAHGYELKRWYIAKEQFWDDFHALVAARAMR